MQSPCPSQNLLIGIHSKPSPHAASFHLHLTPLGHSLGSSSEVSSPNSGSTPQSGSSSHVQPMNFNVLKSPLPKIAVIQFPATTFYLLINRFVLACIGIDLDDIFDFFRNPQVHHFHHHNLLENHNRNWMVYINRLNTEIRCFRIFLKQKNFK